MAHNAYVTLYRDETIDEFEQRGSCLRKTVTTEFMRDGAQNVVFLVAGSGSATATTRGADGDLVYRTNSNTQNTCTLQPWYDAVRINNFDIFSNQGDQKKIAVRNTVGVLNRKSDDDIIAILDTATVQTSSSAQKGTVQMILHGQTILTNAFVPQGSGVSVVLSSAFSSYLLMATEFSNIEYVNQKPLGDGSMNWRDQELSYLWNGIYFVVHPRLTGVGTASEQCYIYHSAAIGHAFDRENFDTDMGYDGQHRRSWVNCEGFFGSKLLQNTGIVQMLHDGSGLAAA